MVEIIRRHKAVLFIFSLFILAIAIWALLLRPNTDKIPMRGVFVIKPVLHKADTIPVSTHVQFFEENVMFLIGH